MKYILIALGFALAAPVFADVGVSINIGEPRFFGRIDIEGAPPPAFLFPRPVIIERAAPHVQVEPLYLHVPVAESRNWKRYCRNYDACGRPVYFVKDNWYRNVYAPHYRAHHEDYEHRREQWQHHYDRHEDHRNDRHDNPREDYNDHHDVPRDDHHDDHRDNDHHDNRRDDRHDDHHDHDDHNDHHDDDRH